MIGFVNEGMMRVNYDSNIFREFLSSLLADWKMIKPGKYTLTIVG